MANTAKWIGGTSSLSSPATLLTGANLNGTGSGSMSATSAAYDNQTNLDLYCDLILHLDALSPVAPARMDIYILVSFDGGTTYPTPSAADLRNQTSQLWCSFPMSVTATTVQDLIIRGLQLPPQKFKVVLDNQSGVGIPANNNSTLKIESYNVNLNS
jgi:hypothetical protein